MSVLSTFLSDRVIAPTDAADERTSCALSELKPGARARIIDVRDEVDPAVARRMFDLGFRPGAQVDVVRRAPMADPVIFRVAGCELALRRAQARCIRVSLEA